MRITATEKSVIAGVFRELDPNAKVFLFGSRADDRLKGGDLDLLVISETLGFAEKLTALASLKERLGDQKVDLLICSSERADQDPFIRSIRAQAVVLE